MTGANELIADAPPNLLTPSLPCAGVKPDDLRRQDPGAIVAVQERKMPWTDVWSAGHGVGSIHDVRSLRALCDRLKSEYAAARGGPHRFHAPK